MAYEWSPLHSRLLGTTVIVVAILELGACVLRVCDTLLVNQPGCSLRFPVIMIYKCCVPTCRGNYGKRVKAMMFSFQKDVNLQQKWLTAIHHWENFQSTQHTKVCELHFTESDDFECYDETKDIKLTYSEVIMAKTERGCCSICATRLPMLLVCSTQHSMRKCRREENKTR